jgi:putative DNA primase/helicase
MTAATVVVGDIAPPPSGKVAYACAQLGFRVFPVSRNARKHPAIKSWPQLATTDIRQLETWWRGDYQDTSVGIACGPASNLWVLDVDVKREDGRASLGLLLSQHGPLPRTMIVGTPSGGLHYYFTYPTDGDVYNSQSVVGPSIDVRGSGGYVLAPFNVNDGGKYEILDPAPPAMAPEWLLTLARQKPQNDRVSQGDGHGVVDTAQWVADAASCPAGRQEWYLFSGLCSMRFWDASEEDMLEAARAVCAAFPLGDPNDPWTSEHAARKVNEVRSRYQPEISAVAVTDNMTAFATQAAQAVQAPPVPQQSPPPQTPPPAAPSVGNVWPNPADGMAVARRYLGQWQAPDGTPYIRHWNDDWWVYRQGGRWEIVNARAIRADFRKTLEHAVYLGPPPDFEVKPWLPNRAKVAEFMDAAEDIARVDDKAKMPSWLVPGDYNADLIPCRNGLLDIHTKQLLAHDPRYFTHMALPIDWSPDAQCPRWQQFMDELWPDDPFAPALLQEWFGYILSGKTDRHKIMLVVGDKRSGKGTIGRILTALLGGRDHIASPSMDGLKERFGLHSLLGKGLALIGDARIAGDTRATVEKLLTISGEDSVNVERKNQKDVVGPLPTRFMLLSNDPPALHDPSGAMASRFLMLHMRESFLGREDLQLTEKLLAELPGILRWALEGLDRLEHTGKFTDPMSSVDLRDVVESSGSPIRTFVEECCDLSSDLMVEVSSLYAAWQMWNSMQGGQTYNMAHFGRQMLSAYPKLLKKQVRVGDKKPNHYIGIGLKINQSSLWTTGQL